MASPEGWIIGRQGGRKWGNLGFQDGVQIREDSGVRPGCVDTPLGWREGSELPVAMERDPRPGDLRGHGQPASESINTPNG